MAIAATHTIGLADPARDTDALIPLVDAYREFYGRARDPVATAAFVRERFARSDTQFFVARDRAGSPIGFAHLLFSLETISPASAFSRTSSLRRRPVAAAWAARCSIPPNATRATTGCCA